MSEHTATEILIRARNLTDAAFKAAVDDLRKLGVGADGTGDKLRGLVSSLDGTKLMKSAQDAVAAVNAIGGASKLTGAEATRLSATLERAIEKSGAMGKSVPVDMRVMADAMKRAANDASELPKQMTLAQKAGGILASTFAQFTAANLAASAIQAAVGALSGFIAQGQKLPALQASFNRLTSGLGQDGNTMLANMTAATRGMVSNYDLMQTANKAMLLGLPVTSASMGDLSKAATTLGRAMGMDATTSLNDLITALGRSSPMILDNLGLTVKVGEANEAYAAKLGKTSEQLTDAEKKTAFYEAAMDAARRKTAELGDQSRTLGEIVDSVWVSIGNRVTSAAGDINVGLGKVLSSWKEFGRLDLSGGFIGAISAAAARARQEREAARGGTGKDINLPLEGGAVGANYVAQLDAAKKAVAALSGEQRAGIAAAQALGAKTEDITAKFGISETVLKVLGSTTKAAAKAGNEYAEVAKRIAAAQIPLTDSQRTRIDQLLKLNIGHSDIAKSVRASEIAVKGYADANKALNDMMRAQIPLIAGVQTAQQNARGALAAGGGIGVTGGPLSQQIGQVGRSALVSPMIQALNRDLANLNQTTDFGRLKTLQFIASWDGLPKVSGVVATFADKLKSVASMAISGFAGALQGASSIKGVLGGFATNFAKDFGATMLSFIPGIGPALSQLAGPIIDGIKSLFSSKGRDVVKDFASSMGGFDALRVKLNALGAEGERLWVGLTQGVGKNNPTQAKAAVDSITAALEKQQAAMAGAGAVAVPTLAEMDTAAKRYGGTLDDLGPKVQALRISEEAASILADFQLMGAGAGEMGGVYNFAKDEVSKLLDEAKRTGAALPAQLKPFVTEMFNAGLLTDAAGDKLKDLEGLTWSESLVGAVTALVDVMKDFVATIKDGAVPALQSLGNVRVSPMRIPVQWIYDAPGSGNIPEHADGAYIRQDHTARVHAGELIGPAPFMAGVLADAMRMNGGGAGGPVTIVVQSVLDGRVIAENQVKYQGRVLAPYGIR